MSSAHKPAAVEIVADLPATTPLLVVPVETVTLAGELGARANAIVIASPDDADAAAKLLVDVSNLSRLIESRRVTVKQPFLDAGRKIDDAVKPYATALDAATRAIKPKLAAWQAEQETIAREAEAKRQAELRRLEAEREKAARDEAEAQKRAAQEAGNEFADFDVTIAQQKQAQTAAAQANLASARMIVQPAKPAGIQYRTTLKAEVLDVAKIPTAFVIVTANMEAIRKNFCVGWKEGDPLPSLPGVRFTADKQAVVSGRR